MKVFFRLILFSVVCIFCLWFAAGFAADKKKYPTAPPSKIAKKWRIGYFESGSFKNYQSTLIATVKGLAELGWIEKTDIPVQENNKDTDKLWTWLAGNIKSSYLEFAADAYYSNNWDKYLREKTKKVLLQRLKEKKDVDLMITMGTWAGQDLANNEHSVPTAVCSVSDAVVSKIVNSITDSGYDHIHARLDPTRYERQIRAFHDVIGFKKLGIAFEDTLDGKSYAAIGDIEKIAKDRNFEIVSCHTKENISDRNESEASVIQCAAELAPKIEAYYITLSSAAISPNVLPKVLEIMNKYKVPTFAQSGADEVRRGVLMSVSFKDFKPIGDFHAGVIAKIINGAKPRDLEQIFEVPVKIAFNKAAAKQIDLRDDLYRLVSDVADEVYETVETGK